MKQMYLRLGGSLSIGLIIALLTGFINSLFWGVMPIAFEYDWNIKMYGYPFCWMYELFDHYNGVYLSNIYDPLSYLMDALIFALIIYIIWFILDKYGVTEYVKSMVHKNKQQN